MLAYEAAISLPNAKNNLAGLLEKSGDHDRAEASYRRVLSTKPRRRSRFSRSIARAAPVQRGAEDAESTFEDAAKLSAWPYACSFNLATLAARGDIQTALARALTEAVAHADADEIEDARGCCGRSSRRGAFLDDANVVVKLGHSIGLLFVVFYFARR